MAAYRPGQQAQHAQLGPAASRYVDVPSLPWKPARFPGVEIKVLVSQPVLSSDCGRPSDRREFSWLSIGATH